MFNSLAIAICVVIILACVATLLCLYCMQDENYSRDIMPCPGSYTLCGREYYNSASLHKSSATPYLLKCSVVERMRDLFRRVTQMFDDNGIDYHLSGGTLLGAVRHKTIPMHTDDDIDLHVDIKHRELLFSREFDHGTCRKYGIQTLFLAFNDTNRADKHGACARFRLDDSELQPVLDVFFLAQSNNKVVKVDGWNGDAIIESTVECWDYNDIYPRQRVANIDGINNISLPHNPKRVLAQQYGKNVFSSVISRPLAMSHTFPFTFLRALWQSPK